MPSVADDSSRLTILDKREGHYLCFPDIGLTESGRLIVVYREADQHVGERYKLLAMTSDDHGKTWSAPIVLNAAGGHCPRISRLSGNQMVVIDDAPPTMYWSYDEGEHWASHPVAGQSHGIPDRLIELDADTLLTTAHWHRGTHPQPVIGQAPTEQMVYISQNRGLNFKALGPAALTPHLTLCEGAIARLDDGRLLLLMRENSQVFEPMYLTVSEDDGKTWGELIPTPMIGHRPCFGVTKSGKLLATYRNVAPERGTVAWMGDVDELLGDDPVSDFQPHGLAPMAGTVEVAADCLRIDTPGGEKAPVLYCLRPMTDPSSATATLELKVHVKDAEQNGFGVRFGAWWRITPGRIRAGVKGARALEIPQDAPTTLRFEYRPGRVTLFLNNKRRRSISVPANSVRTRPIVFGASSLKTKNACKADIHAISLRIHDPRYLRHYVWNWRPEDGFPDEYARSRILALTTELKASPGDYGYSGWVEIAEGEFLCVHHHAEGEEQGYERGKSAHIETRRFFSSDFSFE